MNSLNKLRWTTTDGKFRFHGGDRSSNLLGDANVNNKALPLCGALLFVPQTRRDQDVMGRAGIGNPCRKQARIYN